MAARIDRIHSERVRARIRLSQLVTRMQNMALGRHNVRMTPQQIDAAKFLIGRALGSAPDTTDIHLGGEVQHSHKVQFLDGFSSAPEET